MPSNSYPFIAREGWPALLALSIIAGFSYYYFGDIVAPPAGILFCFTLYLLRDPRQVVPSQPLALVSPVYGTALSIDTVNDPWITRRAINIRLNMSFLDIYSLRSPIEGKIMNQWSSHNKGTKGHRFAFWVKTDEDDDVVVSVYLNLFTAFWFRFYGHSGGRIGHGQRCGYLFLGGVIDVLVPENSKIQVKPGEHMASGSGVLAQLVHTGNATAIRNTDQPHGGNISIAAH